MKKLLVYILAALTLSLTGCSAANRAGRLIDGTRGLDGMERAYKPDRSYYVDEKDVAFIEDNLETVPSQESRDWYLNDRTTALKDRLEAMPEIKNATVVINGANAIIGISLRGNPDNDKIIEVKKKVREFTLKFDTELVQAAVTATPELYERIIDISGHKSRSSTTKRELFPVVPTL